MSVYVFRKSIERVGHGVDYSVRPAFLRPEQWYSMTQMRASHGALGALPGWMNIIISDGTVSGAFFSMLAEYRKKDTTKHFIIATDHKIYHFEETGRTLTDISGPFSFNPNRDYPMTWTTYGDTFYFGNPFDGIYKWTGTGNVTLVTTDVKPITLRVLNNHLAYFGVFGNPYEFGWASEGTENFLATATNDAGSFDLLESDDMAMGLEHLNFDLIGYKEKSIYAFSYIGGRAIMSARRMVSDTGLIGTYAMAAFSDRHIFWGDPPGVYIYTGGSSVDNKIGLPIVDKVYNEIHPRARRRMRTLVNEPSQEIIYFYPSITGSADASYCDRGVVYNYREDSWYGPFALNSTAPSSRVSFCGGAQIVVTLVIDEIDDIIDRVDTIIDLFGVTPASGVRAFATESGKIMQFGLLASDNRRGITREAESPDVLVGREAVAASGAPANFSLGEVFQVTQINLFFEDIVSKPIELYVGSRMNYADTVHYVGPFLVDSSINNSTMIEVPVWPPLGRLFRIKIRFLDSTSAVLLSYQFMFNAEGVR